MQKSLLSINKNWILGALILLSPFLFFFIGLPTPSLGSDAAGYSAYATNLVEGKGYSLDGTTFSNFREPGYSAILAATYALFGIENTLPMVVLQTLLLGLLGAGVFAFFAKIKEVKLGVVAGLAISLLPSYGIYAHRIGTELIFMFLLGLLFYLSYIAAMRRGDVSYAMYAGFGLLWGCLVLMRSQTLFLFPFLVFFYLVLNRHISFVLVKKVMLSTIVFLLLIGSWIGYVHQKTGTFGLTSVRPEMALYLRGVRAQLSYGELTQYAKDWVHRSLSGGRETKILSDNEYHTLQSRYLSMATTSEVIAALKKESLNAIISHPGQYLYGNLIEVIKLAYIEHDYSDFLNKYIRAGTYVAIYALFIFGLLQLIRKNKNSRELQTVLVLALLFIAYNFLVLTPFDTIPRYNTPYLMFYMLVGFAGIALFKRKISKSPEA